jgi:hypothetical protein
MKKLIFMLSAISFITLGQAQGTFEVDTIFNKPKANRLMINLGAQADFSHNGAGSGYYGAYGHARMNLTKFFQVGVTVVRPFTAPPADKPDLKYSVFEIQAAVFFSDKSQSETTKVKVATSGGFSYSASFPTPKRTQWGVCGSLFNWTHPFIRDDKDSTTLEAVNTSPTNTISSNVASNPGVYTNITTSGFSAGFQVSTNTRAKYRVRSTVNGRDHSKKVRKNSSVDVSLEVLFAPVIRASDNTNLQQKQGMQNYQISHVKTKHTGFRIRTEMRKGIFSIRNEIGMRPGVKYAMGGDVSTPGFLRGAYYLLGLGIGIGAL